MEGKMEGKRSRGRPWSGVLEELNEGSVKNVTRRLGVEDLQ